MTEKELQTKIKSKLEKKGFMVIKIHSGMTYNAMGSRYSLGANGFPDLMIIGWDEIWFIEVKKLDGMLSENQINMHLELLRRGIKVKILDNIQFKYDNILTEKFERNFRKYKFVPKKYQHIVEDYIKEKDA